MDGFFLILFISSKNKALGPSSSFYCPLSFVFCPASKLHMNHFPIRISHSFHHYFTHGWVRVDGF